MNTRQCKDCKFHVTLYDARKQVRSHWCIVHNGKIKSFPKECQYKEIKEK